MLNVNNNFNLVDKFGLENPNDVINQLNKQKELENKQKTIFEATLPDSKDVTQLKENLLEEHKAELKESDQKQKISQIMSWIGTNNTFCSEKFEHNDVIKGKLNISSFSTLKNTLLGYDNKEFNDIYNFFYNIYTGNEYREFILKDNTNIVNFVNSQKEESQSFRSFILKLCIDTFIELNKNGKYVQEYLSTMNGKKKRIKKLFKDFLKIKH